MKKYGITILCNDTDGEVYVDTITKLFNTKAEARKQVEESIKDELECLGENYTRVGDTIENPYCETISTYQIHEIEEHKHTISLRESLLLDFKQALENTEFGNEESEDDTYQYLLDQIDIQYRDKDIDDNSLDLLKLATIIKDLDDSTLTLKQSIMQIINFLS